MQNFNYLIQLLMNNSILIIIIIIILPFFWFVERNFFRHPSTKNLLASLAHSPRALRAQLGRISAPRARDPARGLSRFLALSVLM